MTSFFLTLERKKNLAEMEFFNNIRQVPEKNFTYEVSLRSKETLKCIKNAIVDNADLGEAIVIISKQMFFVGARSLLLDRSVSRGELQDFVEWLQGVLPGFNIYHQSVGQRDVVVIEWTGN